MIHPVLIGCEFSATVRDAFLARGLEAWSCDLKPTTGDPAWHIQGDVREAIVSRRWSLIILHPECTAMALCGNKHYGNGMPLNQKRIDALEWTMELWLLAKGYAECVALENPASTIFPVLRGNGADVQFVQPYEHGHLEQKKTGFALHNLPRLKPTNNVHPEMMRLPKNKRERIFHMSPSADRGHLRSIFYSGIAGAIAQQWGDSITGGKTNGADAV